MSYSKELYMSENKDMKETNNTSERIVEKTDSEKWKETEKMAEETNKQICSNFFKATTMESKNAVLMEGLNKAGEDFKKIHGRNMTYSEMRQLYG